MQPVLTSLVFIIRNRKKPFNLKEMRIIKLLLGIATSLIMMNFAYTQEVIQVIRGRIVDVESQSPLPFATVSILDVNPPIGATSDANGNFRLENVPIGRHNIQVSYVGYESKLIPEIMVGSGKEVIVNVMLKESPSQVEEVVVKAYARKDKPLNNMATLSARTFSVEETQRYAGGLDDPARLASSFAGVSTGYLDDNGIIVRGNAPKGLLWRLEGIEIPNPNHFAGLTTFGGGGVSALSSLMLANSDFYTGAFPAEYGNAMSGVFDIRLREGNNENFEHAVQVGALGIDLSSEGPLSKNHNASYLFNYRYSTFGIIKFVLPDETSIPIYQDLCFKISLPTSRMGTFSVWGLGTIDYIKFDAEGDTSLWKTKEDQEIGETHQKMAAFGLNHKIILGRNTYIHSSIAASGDYLLYNGGMLDYQINKIETEHIDNTNYKYTIASGINHKFSAKHSNRTGFVANNYRYSTYIEYVPEDGDEMITGTDESGSSNFFQLFSQSKINLLDKLDLNMGIHGFYFDLNKEFSLEPRIGLTYSLSKTKSISLAYGKHSRLEPLTIYFANVYEGGLVTQPNKNLELTKAHHFVLAYDASLASNLRLKVEPYVQFLFDVPVTPDSSYSTLNMEADWYFTDRLVSEGTGTNYGVDVTFERFLADGYYYLITGSLFESKYIGGDGIERDTRFNTNFVCNFLLGREWVFGPSKNRVLGVNFRFNILGGQKITPVDEELSFEYKDIKYDNSRLYESQKPTMFHLNTSVTYRINKKGHSGIWALQVLNAFGAKENYGPSFNYRTNTIFEESLRVIVPSVSYKLEF